MSKLTAKEYQGFEQIKHTGEAGNEFWFACELAPILEYAKWENFSKVIDRAMLACKNIGGVLPENQPTPDKSIEEVQKEQLKKLKSQKKLMLDE
jgi:DNA-damage-inducible protein D